MASMEITTRVGCYINCSYCPQKKLMEAYSKRSDIYQMTFDVFKKCLDKIPEQVAILFAGFSEPWLNPETSKMVYYTYTKKHRIAIFTTLMGMRLEDIDLIKSIRPVSFILHLPSEDRCENMQVDDLYLNLLEKVVKAGWDDLGVHFYGSSPDYRVKSVLKKHRIHYLRRRVNTRCLNVIVGNRAPPKRIHGAICCLPNLMNNVLLPNGDVLLCSMDYGMKHVLGNLLSSDYNSLFKGCEFLAVKEGLGNESLDILCRYCEEYAYSRRWSLTRPWWEKAKRGFLKKIYLYATGKS